MSAEDCARDVTESVRLALLLGEVERATCHPDGRRETDTTHTVALLLSLFVVYRHMAGFGLGVPIDLGRLLALGLVHDLPEAYAGDVNTALQLSPKARAAKDQREAEAIETIRGTLPDVAALIDEYERRESVEARIVHYVDKMMPKVTHALDGGRAVVDDLRLTLDQVVNSHHRQGAALFEQHRLRELDELFWDLAIPAERVIRDRLETGNPKSDEGPKTRQNAASSNGSEDRRKNLTSRPSPAEKRSV